VLQSFLPVSPATAVLVVNHNKAFYLAVVHLFPLTSNLT